MVCWDTVAGFSGAPLGFGNAASRRPASGTAVSLDEGVGVEWLAASISRLGALSDVRSPTWEGRKLAVCSGTLAGRGVSSRALTGRVAPAGSDNPPRLSCSTRRWHT